MNRYAAALPLALLLAGCSSAPDDTAHPSVLIERVPPRWVQADQHVVAYGTVSASTAGTYTVSKAVDGQVAQLRVAPGDHVRQGQPLLDFQVSAALQSTLQQASTALAAARREQARIHRLAADGLAAPDQLSLADKTAADATAAFKAASSEVGGTPQQMLTAPFDAIVSAVPASTGQRTAAGAPLVVLARRDALIVQCGVEPSEIGKLAVGQAVELKPLVGGIAMAGTVSRVGTSVNEATHLVDVDVGTSAGLFKGLPYRAVISAGSVAGWQVPAGAVQDDESGAHLFQVHGSSAVRVVVQRLPAEVDGGVLVSGRLDPHRDVVSAGAYQLSDGASVRGPGPTTAAASGGAQ
ncbi:TPA: efflux RND transporter periplasmic adaptor subunit [Stenotrophomonas maltophilia]